MSGRVLLQSLGGGIVQLTLSRPEARNALSFDMARQLRLACDEIEVDRDCRVVVLAAEGKGFCAGLDLKECVFGPDAASNAIEAMQLQELFSGSIARLHRLPQPVIAAVQGAAVGAGFGLALAADIRICSASARFLIGAVKIGLSAGECGISYHLPRLIGAGHAFEIMLTGREVFAGEAHTMGLATRVVDEGKLLASAIETAHMIAANSPYSIKHTKQLMWANLDAPSFESALSLENHVQTVAMLSADFKEGAKAFAEKRAPEFRGR